MPLLRVCKETPSIIPACVQGLTFMPPKHGAWSSGRGDSTLAVTMYEGQVVHVVVWLLNHAADLPVGWCNLSAGEVNDVPIQSTQATQGLLTSAAFKPRARLFDSDSVPLGGEADAPPSLPVPFRSTQAMLSEACIDDATHISLSAAQVVAPGDTRGYVVPGGGMLCNVVQLATRPSGAVSWDEAHGSASPQGPFATARFEMEWQYSPSVYSAYLMKLSARVDVSVVCGPSIVALQASPLVS